jgi:lipopolysaccharide transport system permease protein
LKTTIYTPSRSALEAFSLSKMFRDLKDAQFLGRQLFIRDKRAMFRQSFLGILWAFIPPFFTAAAWVFLNMTGAVHISDTGVPYPVYVFCGTILFQTFLESLNAPAGAVNAGKGMLAKLNFPREALLLNAFYSLLFNLVFKLIALVIIALALKFHFGWSLLLFPLGVLGSILLGFSIGVLLIPFQMLYTDFGRMIAISGQVLMYLTPVVYPMPSHGVLYYINKFNPITYIITVPRAWFTGQPAVSLWPFLAVTGVSLIILFLGWVLYRITMPIIIERVGA